MSTFVLIPGAGGDGETYWREVCADLTERGHTAIAVDIQGDDPRLGLPEYAAIVDEAIGERRDVVLVAQSMGAFTAPMIGRLSAVAQIVFINAMIPLPGETPGEWWEATGWEAARHEANVRAGLSDDLDPVEVFLHDVPEDMRADVLAGGREPADTPFGQPCVFDAWPAVPMHALVGADDRLFPADFQVRIVRERLGIDADLMPGGHLLAKSRPVEVAQQLVSYAQ